MDIHRQKIVRRIGDSVGIILNKEEQKIADLKIGDIVYITIKKEESNKEWYLTYT